MTTKPSKLTNFDFVEAIAKAEFGRTYRARNWHFPLDQGEDVLGAGREAVQEVLNTYQGRNPHRLVQAIQSHRPKFVHNGQTKKWLMVKLASIRAQNAMRVLGDGRKASTLALGSLPTFAKGQGDAEGDFATKPMKTVGETLKSRRKSLTGRNLSYGDPDVGDEEGDDAADEREDSPISLQRTITEIAWEGLTEREQFVLDGIRVAGSSKRFLERYRGTEEECAAAMRRLEDLSRLACANESEHQRLWDKIEAMSQDDTTAFPWDMRLMICRILTVKQRRDPEVVKLFLEVWGINVRI